MRQFTWGILPLVAALIVSEVPAFAQIGVPAMPGAGGIGGAGAARPRRPRRNNGPVLSPALNMIPGVATSFEGQFLLRTVPQEQINRNTTQFSQQIQGLQNRVNQQETEIKSGIGKTGHRATFLNTGGYYGGGRRR